MSTPTPKPTSKVVLPLVIAGALLLPMMGCGGLLMLGAVGMAMNGAEESAPTMAHGGYMQPSMYSQPNMPYGQSGNYGPQGSMPPMQGAMPEGAGGGYTPPMGMGMNTGAGAGMGAAPTGGGGMGEVPTYNAMADTPGVNGFSEYIRDQSTVQDNHTGEVVRGVDNTVVQPLVDSGTASVVSSDTPATE